MNVVVPSHGKGMASKKARNRNAKDVTNRLNQKPESLGTRDGMDTSDASKKIVKMDGPHQTLGLLTIKFRPLSAKNV